MSGQKIIDGLNDAIAGNFSRVVIQGQTWVRRDGDDKEAAAEASASDPSEADRERARRLTERLGFDTGGSIQDGIAAAFAAIRAETQAATREADASALRALKNEYTGHANVHIEDMTILRAIAAIREQKP